MANKRVIVGLAAGVIMAVALAIIFTRSFTPPGAGGGRSTGSLPIPREIKEAIGNASSSIVFRIIGFPNGSVIPGNYTCPKNNNTNPPVEIKSVPSGTRSLVLVMYDPDAPGGTFYHWILYNIPPNTTLIPAGIGHDPETPYGEQGFNDYIVRVDHTRQRMIGYGEPCPPRRSTHRYIFIMLALDKELKIPGAMSVYDVLFQARGHVIGYGIYYGVYGR